MYAVVKAAVVASLRQITGIDDVLGYEPQSVHVPRLIYVVLERWDRTKYAGFSARTYRMRARVCFRWQDNEGAEMELDQYVDSLPDAIEADPQFAGTLQRGVASCPEATTDYVDIAGVVFRVLDVAIEVFAKE